MKTKFGNRESLETNKPEIVGYYKHNGPSPIVHTEKFFEMNNYSETTEIAKGIYPIFAGWERYTKGGGSGTLYVEFTGIVTKDNSPSSLEGVVYSKPETSHVNNKKSFAHNLDVVDAIQSTGKPPNITPDKNGKIEPDIYINPKYWGDILSYYIERLNCDIAYLQKVVSGKEKPLLKNLAELRNSASYLEERARTVEEVSHAIENQKNSRTQRLYQKEHQLGSTRRTYFLKLKPKLPKFFLMIS